MRHKVTITLSIIAGLLISFQVALAAYTSDSLVVSLNLDENSGTTASDSSENSNDGSVAGSPTWSGGSITFDGSDDKIIISNSGSLNNSNHSYEVWYTMPSSGTWSSMSATLPRLIDKIPNSNASSTNILIDKTTRKVWVFFAGSTWSSVTIGTQSGNSLIGSTALDYSTNYQITFVYNNTTSVGQIYVNGVLDAQGITSGNYIPSTSNLTIGGRPDDNLRNITGTIHRVSVYGKALSSSEVTSNYTEGKDYNYNSTPDPTAVSAAQSTVTASTNNVTANGVASTTITVTAKNYLGDLLVGKTVSLSSSRGGTDTITPASTNTDASGIAIFTVSSNTLGSPVVTAVAGGINLTTTQTINFIDQYVTSTGVTYSSTLDSLSLKMDIAYDSTLSNAPIVIDLHGYSGPYSGTDIIQRLAKKGVFAIKTYKRGYGGSQGQQDDSGREVYDFYDAIEYVKTNYSSYVDPNNINVIGYSGGGGNAYGLITKFPDYFRSANIFFGMSDYCYDSTYSWWYNGDSSYRTGMQTNIGGTPVTDPDKCYSRAHTLGAKNNPYSHIQLFYDTAETTVPLSHGTQYINQNTTAGFSNAEIHTSDSTSTTLELNDNFSTDLSEYSFIGNGASKFIWNNAGYVNWVGDRTSTFNSVYKKLPSLRNYGKADRIKASFDFSFSSTDANGAILFGFRNSADSTLKNTVSVIVLGQTPSVRIDYNGTPFDIGNRDFTSFTTTLSTSTTYKFDLEINNSVVTVILKNSGGTTLETKTVNFNASKGFDGVDSFGIYNFHNGDTLGNASGTFDNINIDAYARWIHGYPQEGAGTAEGNITAENYFIPDIVAETWSQPTLNTSGTMFIPGYVRTKKFQVFLGNGDDEAGNLTYDISASGTSISNPKILTVEGLTDTSTIALKMYELTPNTSYSIKDTNVTDGGDSISQATSTSDGTLSFSGTLGSTHRYEIFAENIDSSSDQTLTTSTNSYSGSDPSQRTSSSGGRVRIVPTIFVQIPPSKNGPLITSETFTRNLTLQTRGEDVRVLQQLLIASGFLAKGNDTGYFGPLTYQALVQYQSAMGIYPTSGYFGPITRSVIVANANVATATEPTSSTPNEQTFTKDLKFGTYDAEVRFLQQYLNSSGFPVSVIGAGSAGQETTYFGHSTQSALIRFQQSKGITPAIGYFGPITRQYITTHQIY